jgi:hypothetical protein
LKVRALPRYDAFHVERFLKELERCMARLPPAEREELSAAYRDLVRAVSASSAVISSRFRPSTVAALGLFMELAGALRGEGKMIAKLRKLAPTIGPHVTTLVQAL